jgi:hypothetical protein
MTAPNRVEFRRNDAGSVTITLIEQQRARRYNMGKPYSVTSKTQRTVSLNEFNRALAALEMEVQVTVKRPSK